MKKLFILMVSAALVFSCSDDKEEGGTPPVGGTISLSKYDIVFDTDGSIISGQENGTVVTSSGNWSAVGKQQWSRLSAASGESGSTVTFTAEPNSSDENREQTYVFVCGNATAEFTVVQIGKAFDVSKDEFVVDYKGGRLTMISFLNVDPQDIQIDVDWLTPQDISPESLWLRFDVEEYDGYNCREGHIVFFKGRPEEKVVTVYQEGIPLTEYKGPSHIKLDYRRQVHILEFTTNISNYKINANKPWMDFEVISDTKVDDKVRKITVGVSLDEAGLERAGNVRFDDGINQIVILLAQVGEGVESVEIPDPAFSDFMFRNDYAFSLGDNKYYVTENGLNVKGLDILQGNFESMQGIELLKNLETLSIRYGTAKLVDVSTNVNLTSLVFEYASVDEIRLGDSQVESLSPLYLMDYMVSPWRYTTDLVISGKNLLSLNLTRSASFYDYLATLDISGCTALETLNARTPGRRLTTLYMAADQTIENMQLNDNTTIVYK